VRATRQGAGKSIGCARTDRVRSLGHGAISRIGHDQKDRVPAARQGAGRRIGCAQTHRVRSIYLFWKVHFFKFCRKIPPQRRPRICRPVPAQPDRLPVRRPWHAIATRLPHPPRTRASSAQPCSTLPGCSTNPRFFGPSLNSMQKPRPPLFRALPSAPFAVRSRGLRHATFVRIFDHYICGRPQHRRVACCQTAGPTLGFSAFLSVACMNNRPPLFSPLPSAPFPVRGHGLRHIISARV